MKQNVPRNSVLVCSLYPVLRISVLRRKGVRERKTGVGGWFFWEEGTGLSFKGKMQFNRALSQRTSNPVSWLISKVDILYAICHKWLYALFLFFN